MTKRYGFFTLVAFLFLLSVELFVFGLIQTQRIVFLIAKIITDFLLEFSSPTELISFSSVTLLLPKIINYHLNEFLRRLTVEENVDIPIMKDKSNIVAN